MNKILTVALLGATFLYAESSAFSAGDVTSSSSYGLSSNEKNLKAKLDSLSDNNAELNSKINDINQRLEGLQSTLDGINSQYAKSNSNLNNLTTSQNAMENNFSKELANLKTYVEESRKIQDTNTKQIKKVLSELSSLVDSINANYVSKNELEQNSSKITNTVIDNNKSQNLSHTQSTQDDNSWKKKNNNEILDLAIKDITNNAYESSQAKLNFLISKQYKPARATFWLGEAEYKQQNYQNAIAYYKKSSAISTKGDYFPKLLYHTAIALDKTGDTKTANGFYKALKTNYPNSPEAKASPNRK